MVAIHPLVLFPIQSNPSPPLPRPCTGGSQQLGVRTLLRATLAEKLPWSFFFSLLFLFPFSFSLSPFLFVAAPRHCFPALRGFPRHPCFCSGATTFKLLQIKKLFFSLFFLTMVPSCAPAYPWCLLHCSSFVLLFLLAVLAELSEGFASSLPPHPHRHTSSQSALSKRVGS